MTPRRLSAALCLAALTVLFLACGMPPRPTGPFGTGGGEPAPTKVAANPDEIDADGLVLLKKTVSATTDGTSLVITGTVENRRGKKLAYAQILFNVYDDSGAQVGSAIANINNLESGGRWSFKAVALSRTAKTYKFSELSGF